MIYQRRMCGVTTLKEMRNYILGRRVSAKYKMSDGINRSDL